MAAGTFANEYELAAFMADALGETAESLDWADLTPGDPGPYQEAINEALLAYGASDVATIAGADNLRKLRALARREAWKAAVASLSARYAFSADGASLQRNQAFEMAKENLARAEADCLPYDAAGAGTVRVDAAVWIQDPYTYLPDDRRVIP